MIKKFTILLATVMMFTACQSAEVSSSSEVVEEESSKVVESSTVEEVNIGDTTIFEDEPVRTDVDFELLFDNVIDHSFVSQIENSDYANKKRICSFSVMSGLDTSDNYPRDNDTNNVGQIVEDEISSIYQMFDSDTLELFATIKSTNAPADMATFYNADATADVKDLMASQFHTAEEVHNGLRTNIVDDFGYDLVVDWSGTAFGMGISYLEFINEEDGNHAIRFYASNDEINEDFYAVDVRANVPVDDLEKLAITRSVVFSFDLV